MCVLYEQANKQNSVGGEAPKSPKSPCEQQELSQRRMLVFLASRAVPSLEERPGYEIIKD